MKTARYEELIAKALCRPDIAAAGSLAYAAAKCVQYASECPGMDSDLEAAVLALEESAGIVCGSDGEYRESCGEE